MFGHVPACVYMSYRPNEFCVKIGKSSSEMVETGMIWNGIDGSRKGEKMSIIIQEVVSRKCRGLMQMWTEYKPWCCQNSRGIEYRNTPTVSLSADV
jgi:hypothetical protein